MSNLFTTLEHPDKEFALVAETNRFYVGNYIDLQTAHDMIDIYKSRRKDLIDATEGIDDTQSIWFDIDSIFKLVTDVKNGGGSGVRFYFGVYPMGGLYPKKTTIVAIGTHKGADGVIDYDDIKHEPGNPPITTLGDGLDPYNHGNLCPGGTNCP